MLLALLHLGVKNIHLGPTLPAFLSPGVADVLVKQFGIAGSERWKRIWICFWDNSRCPPLVKDTRGPWQWRAGIICTYGIKSPLIYNFN